MIKQLALGVLVLVGSGCIDGDEGIHERIADIEADPFRFQDRVVMLRGEAAEVHPPAGFRLADGAFFSDDIFVLTPPSGSARVRRGDQLELRGEVRRFDAEVEDEYSLVIDASAERALKGRPVVIALHITLVN